MANGSRFEDPDSGFREIVIAAAAIALGALFLGCGFGNALVQGIISGFSGEEFIKVVFLQKVDFR